MADQAGGSVSIGHKALAFLGVLTTEDVAALPPARRRQLADLCAHWAKHAEPKPRPPRSGVLGDLKLGARAD
jgi:hypothetical protein